ncbi:ATP-binding protein [Streptomyces sp. NBC_01092]|uniref:ATP-binding protein n=1 Tax=Streptomyces sp. NBC_01092 TaxID=2903748 RepID=UPI003864FA95|nr:LuxR C-terminal-related transcriptional regulator [Streptomyces sp. NBC_01092]
MNHLPGEMTSFLGRRQAMAEARRLMSVSRLVTLTGVAGVGKTRLALQLARKLNRAFADGVWFAGLADVADPSGVPQTVAMGVDLRTWSGADPQPALADYLAGKQVLLVLDNCEQVLDASALLVRDLLAVAPELRVLVTSRTPLALRGEHAWQVPPLSFPGEREVFAPGAARQFEAPLLFEERAAAVAPGFVINEGNEEAVVQLCRRLDGVPLAIELAALRARAFSVEQILSRLDEPLTLLTQGHRESLPRHRTLRSAMGWSHDLCSPQEQLLWARLSVFAGDFDLDAAEAVCAGDGLGLDAVFDVIHGLLEQSILVRSVGSSREGGPVRYRMLETIRQYGQEQLSARDDGALIVLQRRMRDYYLGMAEKSYEECFGPNQLKWFTQLRVEQANVWASLDFCLTHPGEERAGLQMAGALSFAWTATGCLSEGRYWLDRALKAQDEPGWERARALWAMGYILIALGYTTSAIRVLTECCETAQRVGDGTALAHATSVLGATGARLGARRERATPGDGLLPGKEASGPNMILPLLDRFSFVLMLLTSEAEVQRAVALLEESRVCCETSDDHWQRSWALRFLGVAYWRQGDPHRALTVLRESAQIGREFQDVLGQVWGLEVAAWALVETDADRAACLLGASEARWRSLGARLPCAPHIRRWHDDCKKRARTVLGKRLFESNYMAGTQMHYDDANNLILGRRTVNPAPVRVQAPEIALTKREQEVAAKVAEGMSNQHVASALIISQRTAESHVQSILRKLGFTSRSQIAAWQADRQSSTISE